MHVIFIWLCSAISLEKIAHHPDCKEKTALTCPQNCRWGYCDIMNGTCLGCADVYKGIQCRASKYCSMVVTILVDVHVCTR